MSVVQAVKNYVSKMITESEPGYKIMLMDKETTSFVSVVLGMSEVMRQEVYMFERLDQTSSGENMSYLKCLVYVRPTKENIDLLARELQKPRYGTYYIYFSNVVSKSDVKLLAEADEHEVVREVQELYADYQALSPHLFSLHMPIHCLGLKWGGGALQRTVQGLAAVLFGLQLLPSIRYQNNSEMARTLAENIRQTILTESSLYNSTEAEGNTLLLILDRRDDPVTPLLQQWTYEAMVHELLGVNNGRVSLAHVSGVADDLKEVVMSPTQDEFYSRSMYLNYGEIGQTIKDLMEEYQKRLSKQQKVESISDMKNFVESYPQFKKMSGTVSKHVTVVGELSRLVGTHGLLGISECQQELVCGSDHSTNLQRIFQLVTDPRVREVDAVILVMLYALRHECNPSNDMRGLVSALKKRNVTDRYLKLLSSLMDFGGAKSRQSDLFGTQVPQNVSTIRKRLFKGLKGVDNVYTQHKPLLLETLMELVKGRLREGAFPFCGNPPSSTTARPKNIVVFIVGGATYEESLTVHQFNTNNPGMHVILGGSTIHSASSFLDSVESAMDGIPRKALRI
ncbi:vacuolar protein sorting-associated protein 45-like [Homarus americanus]|uniref:Vacuolar protein sorting-associated protein 45 n=1 Tax=Homarus americanus TaxID=6706 RepID=A0A8J5J9Z0_HOMAM|nr:vacuolar protein sorting-associated protein 45-like [Homarus americanus]KAG7154636.1 Vacuolar protein sorting-associated protein 45-like [Homarus americanus]